MKDTIDNLIDVLKATEDPETRSHAMTKLRAFGDDAVPALIQLLGDDSCRWAAARVLGEMGPAARSAVLPLIRMLRDVDPGDRMHAALALGSMGSEANSAVTFLTEILNDPFEAPFVREAAETALKKIDPAAAALLHDNEADEN